MPASTYRTVLVGTDGSATSLHAVDRAAVIAHNAGAQLLIASAARATANTGANSVPEAVNDALRGAQERARAAGAEDIDTLVLHGDPVDVLADAASSREVDLVVVGNRGLNSRSGRLLGSVPSNLSHRVDCDVLIVHTTGRSR